MKARADWVHPQVERRPPFPDSLRHEEHSARPLANRSLQPTAAPGAAGNVRAMRRAHATRREQLAELPGVVGWFDLEDVAFDAEAGCVVVPFRVLDEAVLVEAPPGLVRRLLRRSGDRYATWRRWLFLIYGAVDLEIVEGGFPENRPCDFLEVDFDPEESEVSIYCDGSWDVVSAQVERIDVVVEETSVHVGWGLVYPRVGDLILGGDGVVLATPPPGSLPIDSGSRS